MRKVGNGVETKPEEFLALPKNGQAAKPKDRRLICSDFIQGKTRGDIIVCWSKETP